MKKKQGHDQTPRSRLAAERNWARFRIVGMQHTILSLENTWIHPACVRVILHQLKRAKSNIDVAWRQKQAKLPKTPAHKHIIEEVTG